MQVSFDRVLYERMKVDDSATPIHSLPFSSTLNVFNISWKSIPIVLFDRLLYESGWKLIRARLLSTPIHPHRLWTYSEFHESQCKSRLTLCYMKADESWWELDSIYSDSLPLNVFNISWKSMPIVLFDRVLYERGWKSMEARHPSTLILVWSGPYELGTAEIRFFAVLSLQFWVSGYCTKWRNQGSFDSSYSRLLNVKT